MSAFVSARQAAELCGVSEKTVRRWIAGGRLKADKRGREFQIAVADLAPLRSHGGPSVDSGGAEAQPTVVSPEATVPPEPALSYLAELVRELQAELSQRAEAVATWQARAETLGRELEETRQALRELTLAAPAEQELAPARLASGPRWHPVLFLVAAIAGVTLLVALVDALVAGGLFG